MIMGTEPSRIPMRPMPRSSHSKSEKLNRPNVKMVHCNTLITKLSIKQIAAISVAVFNFMLFVLSWLKMYYMVY